MATVIVMRAPGVPFKLEMERHNNKRGKPHNVRLGLPGEEGRKVRIVAEIRAHARSRCSLQFAERISLAPKRTRSLISPRAPCSFEHRAVSHRVAPGD